jgi:hypothetical protein
MTNVLLWGVTATAFAAAGVFFVRFWRQTRDRFFVLFAFAFGLIAANYIGLATVSETTEARAWLYALRLAAFVTIIAAIVDKNRRE